VQEGMGGAGASSDDCEVCRLWSIGHMTIGRTHLEVL